MLSHDHPRKSRDGPISDCTVVDELQGFTVVESNSFVDGATYPVVDTFTRCETVRDLQIGVLVDGEREAFGWHEPREGMDEQKVVGRGTD